MKLGLNRDVLLTIHLKGKGKDYSSQRFERNIEQEPRFTRKNRYFTIIGSCY